MLAVPRDLIALAIFERSPSAGQTAYCTFIHGVSNADGLQYKEKLFQHIKYIYDTCYDIDLLLFLAIKYVRDTYEYLFWRRNNIEIQFGYLIRQI